MDKILFIVESPGKIKKIQKILGNKYIVDASIGHVMDIPSDKMNIDIENNFKPLYKVKIGIQKKVLSLKNLVKKCSSVILAMDEDREGEAIAQGLITALNLKKYTRVVFNEITKKAILKAIENPRQLDKNLVNAQKARRVLDKYIGYTLSPCLWNSKIIIYGGKLSAGRVQSIVGRVIYDKEKEIQDFFKKGAGSYFKVKGNFKIKKDKLLEGSLYEKINEAKINEAKINEAKINETQVKEFLNLCKPSEFIVGNLFDKISKKNPSAPFITSSLQQEASSKYGFTPKITMAIAQSLYEQGKITYMRTDSTSLSDDIIKDIQNYVIDKWGKDYYKHRIYKSKVKNAQEAHEAIRPTDINLENAGKTPQEKKLYDLIWKKTVASQMTEAKINNTYVHIDIINKKKIENYYFETKFEEIIFLGFLIVYNEKKKETENIFKTLKIGKKVDMILIQAKQDYEKPPLRFTEASMVKYLEKNGIGRPSTYATMIDKVIDKKYAEKKDIKGEEKDCKIIEINEKRDIKEQKKKIVIGNEKNKLVPTELGIQITDYLLSRFDNVMDYKFTAKMENKFDDISNGKVVWYKVLQEFNKTYEPKIKKEMELNNNKVFIDTNKKELGITNDGYKIIATIGKHGPYVKLVGETKAKSKSSPLKDPLTIDNITLDKAIELLKYPYDLGKLENKKIIVKMGKHGLYLVWNSKNYSVNIDEEELDIDSAIDIIKKSVNNKKNIILKGENKEIYTLLKGPYGNFASVSKGKNKYNISLSGINKELDEITILDIQNYLNKKNKGYSK